MIGTVLNHYRISRALGRGGMGEVYLAHDTRLNRSVAIKILPTGLAAERERFDREAQVIARRERWERESGHRRPSYAKTLRKLAPRTHLRHGYGGQASNPPVNRGN